jgi:FkbM family methyltransferase
MQKRNFYVIAIDPLKSSCNFAENSELDQSKLRIVNAGLWVNSGQTIFHPPKIKTHNSWSILNSQKSSSVLGTKFNTMTISEILRYIPGDRDRQIVVLKIDIEGAERYLFESILTNHNSFDFIAIELDCINLLPFNQIFKRLELILEIRKNIRSLEAVGLTLIHSDYFNFFWLNVNLLSKIKK